MVLTKHIVMLIAFSIILIGFQIIDYYLVVILDDKIVIGKTVGMYKNDSKEKLILSGCYTTIFTLVVAFILLICLIDNILTQSIISVIFLVIVYVLLDYTKKVEVKNYLFIKMDFLIFILYFLLVKNKLDSFTPISIFTFFGLVILYPYFKHVSNTMKKYMEINKE